MAISAGALLAMSALSTLASAGGQGAMGYFQGKEASKNREEDKRRWILEQQERQDAKRTDAQRYRESQINSAPANNISLLSGLTSLQHGMAKPTSLDYLGLLARG